MHRFFIRPETLGYQKDTFNRWDDARWQALVADFRWSIRLREWKQIDRRLRLFVKVEEWDGGDVLLIANPSHDTVLVDAYVKAGFLEDRAIIVFADPHIPWQRLKPFRAVVRSDTHRNSGAIAEGERRTAHQPRGAHGPHDIEERHSGPSSLANVTARSGDPDIVAGACPVRPKQHRAALDGGKVKPSSQSPTLTARLATVARVSRA